MKKFVIIGEECGDMDRSEYRLRFIDEESGEILKEKEEYCVGDVLIDSNEFFHECCDMVGFDSRNMEMRIEMNLDV